MIPSDPPPITPDWRWGTPEGSRELDRLLDRRLSFREIVQWLEDAETLSLRLQAAREKVRGPAKPADSPPPSPPEKGR